MRLICFSHSSTLRGAERSLVDLVTGLIRRGVECHIMLPEEGALRVLAESAGARVLVCPSHLVTTHWHWAAPRRITDDIAAECARLVVPEVAALRPDAILSQTIASPWGAFCAELLRLPHLTSIREYGQLDHGLAFPIGLRNCVQALHDTSERTFCVSQDVLRYHFNGRANARVEVIYSHIQPPSTDTRPARHRPSGVDLEVGIFGSLHPSKGQLELVQAGVILASSGRRVIYHLYGDEADPAYMAEIRAVALAAGISDMVLIHGFTPEPGPAMLEADAVVSCSRREAMGRTLIEAAWLHVPIVYAAAGGYPEVFAPGEEALSYPPGDSEALAQALEQLIAMPESALVRAERARKRCAERFAEETYVGPVVRALKDIKSGRAVDRPDAVWALLSRDYAPVTAQLFVSVSGGFSEVSSRRLEYLPGRRTKLRFPSLHEFPVSGSAKLRLDPADRPGLVQIHSVTARNSNGQRIPFAADVRRLGPESSGLTELREAAHPDAMIAFNDDPWLILPPLCESPACPWELEVELTFSSGDTVVAPLLYRMQEKLDTTLPVLADQSSRLDLQSVKLAAQSAELAQQAANMAAQSARLDQQTAKIATQSAELDNLQRAKAITDLRLRQLSNSLSWRISAPMRFLEHVLRPSRFVSASIQPGCEFNLEKDLGPDGLRRLPNPFRISGWFIDAQGRPAKLVQVRIGDHVRACMPVERADVVEHFKSQGRTITSSRAGFTLELKTGKGIKHIHIEAICEDGTVLRLQSRLRWMSAYKPVHKKLFRPGDNQILPFDFETMPVAAPSLRAIAFYLPQYHVIPENNAWWGEGFTEWTNVRPAQRQFDAHHQPHVPHPDLGYYDLNDAEVLEKQARLARAAGIYGFCFYYYWFGGKRLLEMPLERLLATGKPDMPFCYCWANENWSRRWDGEDAELLIAQNHSPADNDAVIRDLMRAFRDPRYIRVHGRPMLLVYRPKLIPDALATFARWRELCRAENIGEIHLAGVKGFGCSDAAAFGLDALVEFPPNDSGASQLETPPPGVSPDFEGKFYDYREVRHLCLQTGRPARPLYRGVTPSWDNTARRKNKGSIFTHSSPGAYLNWLRAAADLARAEPDPEHHILFINAWNEWAEGCHLEPDNKHGYAWLNATRSVLGSYTLPGGKPSPHTKALPNHPIAALPDIPKIVVAGLFYHREDLIFSYLEKIYPQALELVSKRPSQCTLVVYLNYPSPTDLPERIRNHCSRWAIHSELELRIFHPGYNIGFGAGHNTIFETESSDIYVMVNSDVRINHPEWLILILDVMRSRHSALVGPRATAARLDDDGCGIEVQNPEREGFDFVDGSLLAIHSATARSLGLFAESYRYFYFEDVDLSLRFRQAGARIDLLDLNYEHERSSSTLQLPRPLLNGVLAHNRARFFETWGSYLRTRSLSNRLALHFLHADRAQQCAALPAVFGLLSDHPSARLALAGIHPDLRILFQHDLIDLVAPEAIIDGSCFHKRIEVPLMPANSRNWPMEIAAHLGVEAAFQHARQHLERIGASTEDAGSSKDSVMLVIPERNLLCAGFQPIDETWDAFIETLIVEFPDSVDAFAERAAFDCRRFKHKVRPLRELSANELIARIASARLLSSAEHWTLVLAQLLDTPVWLWQGSGEALGMIWNWKHAGVYRNPGLDCIGCRATLGTPDEGSCLRGDEACITSDNLGELSRQWREFEKNPTAPIWLAALWTPSALTQRSLPARNLDLSRWRSSQADDVLVLIPHKPSAPAAQLARARELAKRATAGMQRSRIVFDDQGEAPPRGCHALRQPALAKIRQSMIDRYLRDEKWVFWVDDDIVEYSADLIIRLIHRCAGGIAAPLVLMEGQTNNVTPDGFGPGRFFDIAGFVEEGRWASFSAPYFRQVGPIYDLDSVGSCYLVNADIYRNGARHEVDPLSQKIIDENLVWPADAVHRSQNVAAISYTEHYSVCSFAKSNRLPVRAFADLIALHTILT